MPACGVLRRFRAGLACAGVPSSWLCGETLFNLFALLKKVPEFSLVTLIPQLGPDMSLSCHKQNCRDILEEFRKLLKNHSFCAVASLSL